MLRFLAVGGFNTALSYVLFRALLRTLGDRPSAAGLAQALSYGAGVGLSYAANRAWTFRSASAHGRALPRFLAAQLASLALSTVVVQAAVAGAGMRPTLAWVLATGVTTVANFVVQRYWVFSPGRVSPPGRAA